MGTDKIPLAFIEGNGADKHLNIYPTGRATVDNQDKRIQRRLEHVDTVFDGDKPGVNASK